jgi:Ca2+/H+ antiporter, TMEM165/GDT1 family
VVHNRRRRSEQYLWQRYPRNSVRVVTNNAAAQQRLRQAVADAEWDEAVLSDLLSDLRLLCFRLRCRKAAARRGPQGVRTGPKRRILGHDPQPAAPGQFCRKTHYRRPWPILAGVLCATLANHAVAGVIGVRIGRFLTPTLLDAVVGVSMICMALWSLRPDTLSQDLAQVSRASAFLATAVAFFIAEIGDKTQIATVALAAAYSNLLAVVAGTTTGMMLANAPIVFLGKAFSERLPLKTIHYVTSGLFLILGAIFISRAIRHPS